MQTPVYKSFFKRCLDIVVSIVLLPLVALVFIIIAPLIYLEDKGSVLYNASRVGRDGKTFTMYKFRSMYMYAPDLKMADGSTYNGADDPRLTKVGAFIRKTSLDEFPQFINVLKGDMSLIGPRPDLKEETELYRDDEARKLEVTPGITGYAQVYGRNAIPWHDRLALDVYYVDHISLSLDVNILFKTIAVVFKQEGVYVEDGQAGDDQGKDA